MGNSFLRNFCLGLLGSLGKGFARAPMGSSMVWVAVAGCISDDLVAR